MTKEKLSAMNHHARPPDGLRAGGLVLAGISFLASISDASAQSTGAEENAEELVIVTGSIVPVPRRQVATAVSVITGDEIETRGLSSLADTMRTQPAIGVSNSGGVGKTTTLRIRGEDGYRTLLMIDGVKAVDASAPQVSPSFDSLLTTGDLERIEVLRGPQGFIYGADAGGVVNILTRTGEGPLSGRIGVEGGEFGTRKLDASVAGGSDHGDYFVAVTDFETDGFNSRPSDSVLRDDDGAENTTLHAKFGWNASESLRVQFVARDIDALTMFDGCGFPTVHDCVATSEQTTYRLSATQDTDRFSNRFGYSEVDIQRDNLTSGVSAFAAESNIGRLEYTGSFRANDATTFAYGFDLQKEEIVSSGTPDERDQDGYYFEYQGDFNDRLFVSVGARYDDNEDFGSATSTRVSAAYVQDFGSGNSIKYRASYGTGFRAPSMFEIAYNAGPFALPPAAGTSLVEETSEGYDIGVEYDTASGMHFELTWFDQDIDDAIEFDLVGFSGYLQEAGTSTSDGFEFATRIPVGDRIEVTANLTDNDARDAADDPRVRRPDLLANFGVRYRSAGNDFRLIANYRMSRDAVDEIFGVGFVPLADYEVLDISAAYRIDDNFEVFGRIENALDDTFSEVTDFNTAKRAAYAGVRVSF